MHPFCHALKDCVPHILMDSFAATVVLNGLVDILAAEHTDIAAKDLVSRILNVVLGHPVISPRFRRFIPDEVTRDGRRVPVDLPSLQELFETLHLVKNTILLARPVTDEDVAAEILANEGNVAMPTSEIRSGLQIGSTK